MSLWLRKFQIPVNLHEKTEIELCNINLETPIMETTSNIYITKSNPMGFTKFNYRTEQIPMASFAILDSCRFVYRTVDFLLIDPSFNHPPV